MKKNLLVPFYLASISTSIATAQYSSGVGIETSRSNVITEISIPLIIYTGECPGVDQTPQTGYFVSDSHPPYPGYNIKLTNMSRGLSPDNPPYTIRNYSKGRASQSFEIALGSKHRGSFFVVKQGENTLQYEIIKEQSIIHSGIFRVLVITSASQQNRAKKKVEITKFNPNGSSYKDTEYRCE
jgi:hypothetical protein